LTPPARRAKTTAARAPTVRGSSAASSCQAGATPQPPADLADRVIAAVRAEAQLAAEQTAADVEAAQFAARPAEQTDAEDDAARAATLQPSSAGPIATLALLRRVRVAGFRAPWSSAVWPLRSCSHC